MKVADTCPILPFVARQILLSDNHRRASRFVEKPSDGYESLQDQVNNLAPDESVFVTMTPILEAKEGAEVAVRQLRARLRQRLRGRELAFVEDFERKGVWVYRRREGLLLGNSRALGSSKEDEIRSRPLETEQRSEEPVPNEGGLPGFQDRLVDLEYELSHVEASFGEIANEPFPQYPGVGASSLGIEGWNAEHDRRTRRLIELMETRAVLLKRVRELLTAFRS